MSSTWVVIVTYNSADDILDCLNSIDTKKFKVAIVDNGSIDGTLRKVRSFRPRVEVIRNKENIGFAGGSNIGIRHAINVGASFVIMLNPDTVVGHRSLERLVLFLSNGETRGIAGPAIEYEDLVSGRRFWDLGGKINWLLGRATHIKAAVIADGSKPEQRDYVSGCCMAIKTAVFEIGFLDERFFMYYEDDDFCARAAKAGFTVWNVPSAKIYHKFARSTGWLSPFSAYHLTRSAILFGDKWLNAPKKIVGVSWIVFQAVLFSRVRIDAGLASFRAIFDCLFVRSLTRVFPQGEVK